MPRDSRPTRGRDRHRDRRSQPRPALHLPSARAVKEVEHLRPLRVSAEIVKIEIDGHRCHAFIWVSGAFTTQPSRIRFAGLSAVLDRRTKIGWKSRIGLPAHQPVRGVSRDEKLFSGARSRNLSKWRAKLDMNCPFPVVGTGVDPVTSRFSGARSTY
jgi:hypothetical protein